MNKRDWSDYADYLRSMIPHKDYKPQSIGEAYNIHVVVSDLADVRKNKLGIKPKGKKNAKGKA